MPSSGNAPCTSSLLLLSAAIFEEISTTNLDLGSFYRRLLKKTVSSLTGQGPFLDIAVDFSSLQLEADWQRGKYAFQEAQRILASLYSELSILSRRLNKDGLIDVRIIFVDSDTQRDFAGLDMTAGWPFGPVFPFSIVMKSGRKWDSITVAGTELSVKRIRGRLSEISYLQYDVDIYTKVAMDDHPNRHSESMATSSYYSIVAVGGTFDHLHAGHKLLLTMTAFSIRPSDPATVARLIIGLTGPGLLKSKRHVDLLSSWETRAADTFSFLKKILVFDEEHTTITTTVTTTKSPSSASTPQIPLTPATQTVTLTWGKQGYTPRSMVIEIVEINDPFGPTITNKNITALVVSEETASGARLINGKRKENGWNELDVLVVDVIKEGEGSEKLSSTEIRARKAAARNP